MKIFIYSDYPTIEETISLSPWLFEVLVERKIPLQEGKWNGELAGPHFIKEPSLIRGSPLMPCRVSDLAELCQRNGHFLFFNEDHITPTEKLNGEQAKQALREWLDKNT